MKAYFLFENLELLHAEKMDEYRSHVLPLVKKYGGTYLIVDGQPQTLEGDWSPSYIVLIEFPNKEQAEAWYYSEKYAPLKALRFKALKANGVLMNGLFD